jgi:hypothetical protein
LVILVDGKVVGSALSLIVDESLVDKNHITLILLEIYLSTHNQKGMSCTELIFYTPQLPWTALSRRLYDARKELCEQSSKPLFCRKDPNYGKHSAALTPKKLYRKEKSCMTLFFSVE